MATATITKVDGTVQSIKINQSWADHAQLIGILVTALAAIVAAFSFNSRLAVVEANNVTLNRSIGELTGTMSSLKDTINALRTDLRDQQTAKP